MAHSTLPSYAFKRPLAGHERNSEHPMSYTSPTFPMRSPLLPWNAFTMAVVQGLLTSCAVGGGNRDVIHQSQDEIVSTRNDQVAPSKNDNALSFTPKRCETAELRRIQAWQALKDNGTELQKTLYRKEMRGTPFPRKRHKPDCRHDERHRQPIVRHCNITKSEGRAPPCSSETHRRSRPRSAVII